MCIAGRCILLGFAIFAGTALAPWATVARFACWTIFHGFRACSFAFAWLRFGFSSLSRGLGICGLLTCLGFLAFATRFVGLCLLRFLLSLTFRLLAHRFAQKSRVMFCVLLEIFHRHAVTCQGRVARQLVVLVDDLLRRAADLGR